MKQEEETQKRIEEHARKVNLIYAQAADALIALALGVTFYPGKSFKFKNYARIADQVNAIFTKFYSFVYAAIRGGIESEWAVANAQMDAKVFTAFGKMDVKVLKGYLNHNPEAMNAFFARKSRDGGLNLSQRVWKYTGQLRTDLEAALQVGIAEGKSAQQLARQVRKYLQDPEGLLKKAQQLELDLFKENRGKGVYKSAFKNAMRLTRTEINMAYHAANHERRKQLDIIVGFEVHTSDNHKIDDICDLLAGNYPKSFKFIGWHPACFCFTTDILCTQEELAKLTGAILSGEEIKDFKSINQVKTLPVGFTDWVEANKERATGWASLPYFLRDNIDQIPAIKGLF